MAYAGNVDAARGNIRCDEDFDFAITKCLQRSGPLALAFVAVNGGGLDASASKPTHNAVSAMLGTGKNQRTVNFFALQLERQQSLLFALFNKGHELLNALCRGCRRCNRHAHRIVEEAVAQFSNRLWHGCREEQCLTLLWQQLVNTLQRMDETKVHHLVRFIKDENFDVLQRYGALFNQIDQTARSCDQNIDAASKTFFLAENGHAAKDAIHLQTKEFAIGAEAVGDLRSKLAGWRQHQHTAAILLARFWLCCEMVQRWQSERRSLTGSGLRDTAQVAALQQWWDRLLLDWRRGIISRGFKRLKDRLG